jgi:inner membrane protein
MTEQPEQKRNWYKDSILIKLGIITALILLLLIPSAWIQDLILEREGYQQGERNVIANKWGDSQFVQGPVLMLPYKKLVIEKDSNKKITTHEVIHMLYVLPQNLSIKANVKTEPYRKGIHDITLYDAHMVISGNFDKPNLAEAGIDPASVMYDKARLVFSISDLKGLKNNPVINIQGANYTPEPTSEQVIPFDRGLQAHFILQKDQQFAFNYQLDLNGTNELSFLHTGKTTDVEVTSDWKSPFFNSRYMPDHDVINDKGFTANWHMLFYNRPFPQQWVNNAGILLNKANVDNAKFGVKMQLPVDQYRKIVRTAKYSTLIILLTFISLFLAEVIKKQGVHVFNYILIGAAMVVYYILLLSFAEQIGYNLAYLLSSVSTITLIAIFTASLLNNKVVAVTFSFILSVFYGFIFIIIQLEELSLLFGGIALFAIVATLMYFSRKINWDNH